MILFSGKITQKYTAEDRENVLRFQRYVYTCVQFEKFNIFSHSDFYVKSIQWNYLALIDCHFSQFFETFKIDFTQNSK